MSEAPETLISSQGRSILTKAKDNIRVLPSPSASISIDSSLRLEHTFFVAYCEGLHLLGFCGQRQPEYVEADLVNPLFKDFFNETEGDPDSSTRDEIFKKIGSHFNNMTEPIFFQGVDVSLLEVDDTNSIQIRTYDHVVHREVQSHGNAAAAAAMVAHKIGLTKASEIRVFPRGANQRIRFQKSFINQDRGHFSVLIKKDNVFLEGPAEYNNNGVTR